MRSMRTIRRLRVACHALLILAIASEIAWLYSARHNPSFGWLAVNLMAMLGFFMVFVLVCTRDCPTCGRPIYLAKDEVVSCRALFGKARCVHCGTDINRGG